MTPQEYVAKLKAERDKLKYRLMWLNVKSEARDRVNQRLGQVELEIRLNENKAI